MTNENYTQDAWDTRTKRQTLMMRLPKLCAIRLWVKHKKGDLAGVFVYKFKCNGQLALLAYEYDVESRLLLLLRSQTVALSCRMKFMILLKSIQLA
jgi:hypothetical protein